MNDDTGTAVQYYPAIAIDKSGNFVITWDDYRNGNFDIYAQRYNSSGTTQGSNFKINDDAGTASQWIPDIALDGFGNFVITWTDERNDVSDIYARRYNSSGTPLGSSFKVNDDIRTASQGSPDIAIDGSGDFVITWHDERNGNYDIYAQRYNSSGLPLGTNFKVNSDTGTVWQMNPAIAMDGSGNIVITWFDYRNGNYDIYAQRYNPSGTPLDSNFKVNAGGTAWLPAIAMDGSGNFVITWYDYRNGNEDIYAQRYNSLGTTLGSNFKVNDDLGTADQYNPAIAMDGLGSFVITWYDGRNGSWDIYAQRYNSSGTQLDSNFKVNDDGTADEWSTPAIASDGSDNFVITWGCKHNGDRDIYAQIYDSSGDTLGSNFKVNDDVGSAYQIWPAIAMDGSGKFVITWYDYRNGNGDIYAQIYNSAGDTVGPNYLVNNLQYVSFAQVCPAVAANSSNIYFAWMDNRRAKGWDIYAKVADSTWSSKVEEDHVASLQKSFELSQNYPNPFNPTTTIHFRISCKLQDASCKTPIQTTLTIYNILGQKVRTLVDEDKLPGEYKVIWDGKDKVGNEVASGIYFYQLKTKDFTQTKKMLLLR